MTILAWLLAAASIFYALSCWNSFRYYQNLDPSRDRAAVKWLGAGLSAQMISLFGQWIHDGFAPLITLDGILLAFSFSLALILFIGRLKTPVPVLTSLFIPFIFFVSLMSFLFSFKNAPLMDSHLMTFGMTSHIFLIFLGFSSFTMGFGVGVAFWIQEGQLKQHQVKNWSYRLPALELLESLTVFYIGLGLLFWSGGLALGLIQAYQVWGHVPFFDPKIFGSFMVLVIYSVFFLLRWGFRVRGKRTMFLVMAGYFLALFTFLGIFLTTHNAF
jgi:HemX protein